MKPSSKDQTMKDQLIEFNLYVNRKIEKCEREIASIGSKLSNFCADKNEFYEKFKSFCTNIDRLQISNKRILIDNLIDKIIVYSNDDNSYNIEIIINIPLDRK